MVSPEQLDLFLDQLRATRSVAKAARAAGLHRPNLYARRARDDEFRRRWDESLRRQTKRGPASLGEWLPTLNKVQRQKLREFLASLREGANQEQKTRAALNAWLSGQSWPSDDELDIELLRKIAPRAAHDYEQTRAAASLRQSPPEPEGLIDWPSLESLDS